MPNAHVIELGLVPYTEAWDLQRAVAAEVADGTRPDTILLLEHPPTVTTGRRTEESELHIPPDAEVDVVETDRGGKSTFHGPGQLVCYPIFDLTRHGQDVKRYCRDLEEALILTLRALGVEGERIDGHFVEVDDVDAHHERARAAGATILREPEEPGIGFRIYTAEDPDGHRWMFGQRL